MFFHITEVFSHCKTSKTYAHTSPWWLIHLSIYEGCFIDNARLFHFVPQVITFTSTFPYTGEYGIAAVLCSNIVNQFHNQYGFTYTGTTEKTDFTTFYVWSDKVNDLNTCFQDLCIWRKVIKFRCWTVNRPFFISHNWSWIMVYSFTKYVKDTTQYAFPYRNGNWSTSIFCFHITCHTVSRTHGNATNCIVA